MKVLIFNSYGNHILPSFLAEKTKFANSKYSWRYDKKLLDFIDSMPESIDAEKDMDSLKMGIIPYFKQTTNNQIYVFFRDGIFVDKLAVIDVDTSCKWAIHNYDGCEYIKYLDVTEVDTNVNLCEF